MSKKHEIKVALLSNVGLEHSKRMGQVLSQGTFFEDAIKHFSCHVGARKPTLLYYHLFLQLHPEFEGAVYVDDLQENLDASKQFGFKTFHFSLEEINQSTILEAAKIDALKKLLISSDVSSRKNTRRH